MNNQVFHLLRRVTVALSKHSVDAAYTLSPHFTIEDLTDLNNLLRDAILGNHIRNNLKNEEGLVVGHPGKFATWAHYKNNEWLKLGSTPEIALGLYDDQLEPVHVRAGVPNG
jgi:hypothetical protein